MYRTFEISKGKGKTRIISAPDQRLKFVQRKIADLLGAVYKRRNPVHGFVNDRSVKTNALSHIKSKFVLNLDIEKFFPSITETRVRGVLRALDVDSRVAEVVARICCNNGQLPQGAPSSPVLSNMICFRMDRELLEIAKDSHSIYTRYADDITFSSYQPLSSLFDGALPPPGPVAPNLLAPKLRRAFETNSFTINPAKAHYADRHSRRTVTGLKINEALNVDRNFVRNIRAALYAVEKGGEATADAIFKKKYGGTASIADHLQGKLAWLGNIKGRSDPIFRSIAERFNHCFPKRAIKLEPTKVEIRDRSVWIVEHGDSQGSAFFLKDVGLVTAAHCVEGVDEAEVYHPTKPSNKFKVTIAKRCDPRDPRDLAILDHNIQANEYYQLDRSNRVVGAGDEVTAVGYPSYGPGDKINIRFGTVSSLPIKSAVQKIEVTQTLAPGMSGGPIIDSDHAVVGVIHKGGPEESRNFAIHIKVLNEWINEPK
ncbi:MAG: reverse transcriptase domain-containing protein [Candidatus Pacebacteria bacterium]|nr:reverse transcriptase domain-containing protein [Candidatus Paceibacterota bacterium]